MARAEPDIQVNVPTTAKNGCTPYVYVDGIERDILADGVGDPSVQVQKVQTSKYEGYIVYYHKSKMQYHKSVDQNLPIGSGVTESACKELYSGPRF